jgi:hypothetical protein
MHSLIAAWLVMPFDPRIDTALGHRNLIAIYIVVGVVQVAYAVYALRAWRASGRDRNDQF